MKKITLISAMLVLFTGISLSAAPRILIASYSWSGNTRFAAQQIQKAVGGTLWEITPVKPYPKDYKKCVAQARKETKAKFKPELTAAPDLSKYDVVFIGSPNWCGTIAPPVATFASDPALKGKKVYLFITHGRGGLQRCVRDFNALGIKSDAAIGFPGKNIKKSGTAIGDWAKKCLQ